VVDSPETFYQNELNDSRLYKSISKRIMSSLRISERDQKVAEKLMELSSIETTHAKFWEEVIRKRGGAPPPFRQRNPIYFKYLGFLQKLFGISFLIRYLERGEVDAIADYSEYLNTGPGDEWEKNQLKNILNDEKNHEQTFIKMTEELKGSADKVKDAIYGMSDGLIEVLAGLAALTSVLVSNTYVAVGGIVFGISGLISMTIGSYLSEKAKEQISENRKYSGRKAAINTATYYGIGAAVPIIPFLFLTKYVALGTSFVLVIAVDFIATSVISIQSDGNLKRDTARSIGLVVAGFTATFIIGMIARHFVGVLG
jgi:VIT1/CCC1 family predicted Fe2+/Mn2+ transporter